MNNNIPPPKDIRKRYIKNNNPDLVKKYIKNLERLSREKPEYKQVYEEDLKYYNKIGGFLSSKRYGTDCRMITEGKDSCQTRATRLLEINAQLSKYVREGKIPLMQAQKVVKDFIDTCLCCEMLYSQRTPENTIVNLMAKILKKITGSIPLLEYAYKYVLPIYFNDKGKIFDEGLYATTGEYLKNPNNPIIRRKLKDQILENNNSYKTITTGIITSIFMAVEKKFH